MITMFINFTLQIVIFNFSYTLKLAILSIFKITIFWNNLLRPYCIIVKTIFTTSQQLLVLLQVVVCKLKKYILNINSEKFKPQCK